MTRYCLDANVFIQAKNGPYAFDIVPRFWAWLEEMMSAGAVYSCLAVLNELALGHDELAQWTARTRASGCFVTPTQDVQTGVTEISTYVVGHYELPHAQTFLSGADPWVIAQARVDSSIVVTHEARAGLGSKRVKMPNICTVFGVNSMDLYPMMRALGARFA